MPQIYVHIGLPKTATTTLQTQAFQHHEGWAYLGTRTPRMLNADPTFKVLEAYVQRGEGALSGAQEALASRLEREGKPLMVSEENFSLGAFQGYPSGHPLSETRSAKWARLAQALEPFRSLTLVSLRPFRASVFSAYVEYQEQWSKDGRSPVDLVKQGDVMGMYRTSTFREEVATHFGADVHALAFEDVIKGDVAFPGFRWDSEGNIPNTRQHPRAEGGVIREVVRKRPLMPLARAVAPSMPGLAQALWRVRWAERVMVQRWDEEIWEALSELEAESDAAREAWLCSTVATEQGQPV